MIKSCVWKGEKLNCSSIFTMYPTDRGMCCTFNKQKADDMFKQSRYQDQLQRLSSQDKDLSFENSGLPSWFVFILYYSETNLQFVFAHQNTDRYDPMPWSGKSKGLVLVLDAHTDKVTGSSISSDFEVN